MSNNKTGASTPRTVQSVEHTIDILDFVRENEETRIRDIAESIDLSKPSIHTHLTTLCGCGYLIQNGETYKLGMEFIPMGEYVKNHIDIYRYGRTVLDELAAEKEEATHLVVEHDGLEMTVYESWGEHAVATNYHTHIRGKPQHLHYSSTGKSILAHLPETRVEEIIDNHGLPERTKNTITDPETLFDQLENIREQGYALNDQEEIHGIRAVGAPILNKDGDVLGALSVSGPTKRLSDDAIKTDLPERVMHAANVIEINTEMENIETN